MIKVKYGIQIWGHKGNDTYINLLPLIQLSILRYNSLDGCGTFSSLVFGWLFWGITFTRRKETRESLDAKDKD